MDTQHIRKIQLLIVLLVIFSLVLFIRLIPDTNNRPVSAYHGVRNSVIIAPVRLRIPVINVDASIQYVGVTKNGAMDVPDNSVDVGWFKIGPRPGEKGSAVISGHFDGKNSEVGVFAGLDTLKSGDRVYIANSNGSTTTFVVRESRTYDPGYADDVFRASDTAHLNLITCDGVWDRAKKSYSKRLVVFTDML